MFPEGNVPGYVCNPGSPRERDAASQGHTSGIPTRAMLHSWKLAPAAHHVLLSILVMTSPHLTSGRQFWLITHMIQSWTTLMAFPIASRHSVSFPRGTRVTYVMLWWCDNKNLLILTGCREYLYICVYDMRIVLLKWNGETRAGRYGWKLYHDISVSYRSISIIIDIFYDPFKIRTRRKIYYI